VVLVRVTIDTELCCGHGRCYQTSPELFTDDERGYGQTIKDGVVAPDQAEAARRAIVACPEKAITLSEEESQRNRRAFVPEQAPFQTGNPRC
jgi:ferredoxin